MRAAAHLRRITLALACTTLLAGCANPPTSNLTPQPAPTTVAQASAPAAATAQPSATDAPTSPTGAPAGAATAAPATSTPPPTAKQGCEITPPDLDTRVALPPFEPVRQISSANGVLSATLVVTYTDPAEIAIATCPVHLRSYNGELVGPTLRARPGDTLYIQLDNQLLSDSQTLPTEHFGLNTTNFHTHGLHVSPVGNSDNVLLELPPKQSIRLEIKIPPDHLPGTYWYHAHLHGATAVQVSSGMEGALIIEGDIDQVPAIAAAEEQILLVQQVYYDQQGEIESNDDFGPNEWDELNRQHTINGQLFPEISMQPGEVQRWRMIQGGVRETTCVALLGPTEQRWSDITTTITAGSTLINPLYEIAVDGISLRRLNPWKTVELEPGYRSDVLVRAGLPGTYYLVDLSTGLSNGVNCSLRGDTESNKLLATVQVQGDQLDMALPTDAELAALQRPAGIADSEIAGTQEMEFCVCPTEDGSGVTFTVNGEEFNENEARQLTLGKTEQWELSVNQESFAPAHPFHIHVNPFQMCRTGADGTGELVWKDTVLVRVVTATQVLTHTVYPFVTDPTTGEVGCGEGHVAAQGEPLLIRTRYQDYIGKFVLHCHILDHEDGGMMQLVEVVLPNPQPSTHSGAAPAQGAQASGPAQPSGENGHDHADSSLGASR